MIRTHHQPGGEMVASATLDGRTLRVVGLAPRFEYVSVRRRVDVVEWLEAWLRAERGPKLSQSHSTGDTKREET